MSVCLARIRFLTGDIDGAVELTYLAIRKIRAGSLPPQDPKCAKYRAIFFLNKGFLSFIKIHWSSSAAFFTEMLSVEQHKLIEWDGVIDFIDYVASLGYEHVEFLQVLYRFIAGKGVADNLRRAAFSCGNEDGSRA